jgi:hypothetical protein
MEDSCYHCKGKKDKPNQFACKACIKSKNIGSVLMSGYINTGFSDTKTPIVQYVEFSKHQQSDAEALLKTLSETLVVSDLHGVWDLFDINEKPPVANVVVVSFVGKLSNTRIEAQEDIEIRVKDGTIKAGFCVFERKDPPCLVPGSKAWFVKQLKLAPSAFFIDDSSDHVESVATLNIPSILIKDRAHLEKTLSSVVFE